MIIFKDVSILFHHGSGMRTLALQDIDLKFEPNIKYAILGANGSGKSTLIKAVNGLLIPKKGSVEVQGLRTDDPQNATSIRTAVQLVFQDPDSQLVTTVVEDEVAFGLENLNILREDIKCRVDEVLELFELMDYRYFEPHNLSGGQKQRLAIACAVAMRPTYLLLDEPTSMLDGKGKKEIAIAISRLKERSGIGVIQVTHSLSEALEADEVLLLDKGKLIFKGTPMDILISDAILDRFKSAGVEIKSHHMQLARIIRVDKRLLGTSVSQVVDYLLEKDQRSI